MGHLPFKHPRKRRFGFLPPWPWSVAAADRPCALLWCVATCTFAECPWAMTPKKRRHRLCRGDVPMLVAFGFFMIFCRKNSHDRKTMTAYHFCEQTWRLHSFSRWFAEAKIRPAETLKQSGQKAWRSFWKPTLPAPMYPYLMMGLDLSGTSAADPFTGVLLGMLPWCPVVISCSGIGPWNARTATNVIHVWPIKVWPLFKFIKSTTWFRKQYWSFNQHPTPRWKLGLWHILLEAWVVPYLPQTLQEKGSEKLWKAPLNDMPDVV